MSAYPRLIHPIKVTIEQLDRSVQLQDDDAREPIHGPRSQVASTFTVPAQVKWDYRLRPDAQSGGVRERSAGYILVRSRDMDRILGTDKRFKRGDRIRDVGAVKGLQLFITKQTPKGHLSTYQGQTLIAYHFEDRAPVQE